MSGDPAGPPAESPAGLGRLRARLDRSGPILRAMLWTMAAGLVFSCLNATMRVMTHELDPMQVQFLRYLFGLVVMIPLILRAGLANYRPNGMVGQLWRGAVHTIGLVIWFIALPHVPLADMTAMGFTGPIFTMIGATFVLREKMVPARWVAAVIGFVGVVIVVAPKLGGSGGFYNLLMLASSPVFAASFLITKVLTRRDRPEVIVAWQAITVAAFSLPLAMLHWTWPTPSQWAWAIFAGGLGSLGHYCLTRSFVVADISATQSVKFLDLIWASVLGFLVFGDRPSQWTIVGGLVIFASTLWIARREARARAPQAAA